MSDSSDSNFNQPIRGVRRRGVRLMSILSIGSSCLLFGCAGCCFLATLLIRSQVVDTPGGADEAAARITDWTLPTGFIGKSGATIDNAVFRFDIARFANQQGRGHLVLAQFQWKWMQLPDLQERAKDLIDKNAPELKKINVEEQETRIMTIRNLPAEFQIGRGEDRASTTKYRQVLGQFRGKRDNAFLILQYEDELLTDEDTNEFLKTIR